jgi:DNA polymerase
MSEPAKTEIERQMEELRQKVLNCRACELCETRTNVVFGEGNPHTPLVLVGEGPGATEDLTGRPFVGRAGQLLDQALRENGITRKHVYICNVLKCRACLIENGSIRNRPPRIQEINACLPWLEQQLAIIKPLVILCLGGPAASVIIRKDFRMTKERGLWFPSPYAKYAMAALHPAFILRQYGENFESARASLVSDIAAARRKVIEAKREAEEKPKEEPKLSLF